MVARTNGGSVGRRAFLKASALGAVGLMLGQTSCSLLGGEQRPQPNVLLVTTDDQGMQAGCYGDSLARTPNMDRLAAEGVRFSRAYVTQASCSPSRSSIFTGLYPHQNGQIGLAKYGYRMFDGVRTLPAILKEAGYATGVIGKVHVHPGDALPFDYQPVRKSTETRDVAMVADRAGEFFESLGGRPFFLKVSYVDPHRPFDAACNQFKGIPANPLTPEEVKPFAFLGADSDAIREEIAAYYNAVERADGGIGMLLDRLEQVGLADDTIVIVLGDHGPPMTRAKTTCYEAGVQIPLLIRWPGRAKAGRVSDALVSTVDILPTVLAAAGIEAPDGLAGASLVSDLRGRRGPWRKTLCTEYTAHGLTHYYPRRAIRDDRFKLILNLLPGRKNPLVGIGPVRARGKEDPLSPGAGREAYARYLRPPPVELYDLRNDPDEFENLAGKEEYREVKIRLLAQLEVWRRETDDRTLDPAYLARMTEKHDELRRTQGKWDYRFME